MVLLEIEYKTRVYHRTPTCGGMDSEPAGSTVETKKTNVVIADEGQQKYALAWFDESQSHDDSYERLNHRVVCGVQAILRRPITNLSLV